MPRPGGHASARRACLGAAGMPRPGGHASARRACLGPAGMPRPGGHASARRACLGPAGVPGTCRKDDDRYPIASMDCGHGWAGCATLGPTIPAPASSAPSGGTDHVAKVTMPQLGESVAEGTIGRWLKQPGDTVEKYEPLLEVITDKVNAEVPSPFAGRAEGDPRRGGRHGPQQRRDRDHRDRGRGAVAGRCRRPAAAAAARGRGRPAAEPTPAAAAARPAAATPAAGAVESAPGQAPAPQPAAVAASTASAPSAAAPVPVMDGDPNARMTPAVRRLLREHDLERAPDRGHRRRRPDHPRGRDRRGRGDPDRHHAGDRCACACRACACPGERSRRAPGAPALPSSAGRHERRHRVPRRARTRSSSR